MMEITDHVSVALAHISAIHWTTRRTCVVTMTNGKSYESDTGNAQHVWDTIIEALEP